MSAAGAGLQAFSQFKQGQIADAQGRFDEKIAQRNQQSLERQAVAETEASKVEETRIARRSRIVLAQQRANQAGKSGIDIAGATIESLADTAFQFSLDRNLTLRTGLIRSRELIQRGNIFASEGRFARIVGGQRRTAFNLAALGSLAGAAGSGGTSA